MNTIVTSKEEILKNSRELIREKGWAAVSIRSVASACGVSVGSIYNYLGFMQEDKADGKRHMQRIWRHILNGLCTVLQQDAKIRPGAFNEQFTVEKFADVLFSLMLSALLRQDYDPAAVLEIVRRTLY